MSIKNELVSIEITDSRIAVLKFNNPKSLNALSIEVLQAFEQRLIEIKENKRVLGVILTGEGEKAFVAGADIKQMLEMSTSEAQKFSFLGQNVTTMMEDLDVPVIACVNGFALGGGLEMALGADFIYCSGNAVFGLPEVKLGLIPGFGGTQRLAKVVGRNRAKELIYSGRNVLAEEAREIGLVNRVFDSIEEMLVEALAQLVKMQKNSIFAIGQAKAALNSGVDLTTKEGLERECSIFSNLFDSYDAKEGTKAFAEKRAANFEHLKGE